MARVGYLLSGAEFSRTELAEQASVALEAGFHALWISGRLYPWNEARGPSACGEAPNGRGFANPIGPESAAPTY